MTTIGASDIADRLVAGCALAGEGVGPARLIRTRRRIERILHAAGVDAMDDACALDLFAMAASNDLSSFVQASALVSSQRLTWTDLHEAWSQSPHDLPWLIASAVVGAGIGPTARLGRRNHIEPTRAFLAACPEERGPNALTRAGGVTRWSHDGVAEVAKQRLSSTGCLEEHVARRAIAERLDLQPSHPGCRGGVLTADLEVLVPDGTLVPTAPGWTLETRMIGPTVEDLLLGPGLEPRHLTALRTLGSSLLELGIEWGDLSPRNIVVVDAQGSRLVLALVDFEKVRLADRPFDAEACFGFVRAGTAIEEFGPLCTDEEMEELFGERWLDGTRPHRHRRELAHLLQHRGASADDPAAVDEVDRLIWLVRRPSITRAGRTLPGAINIRLQHYATCLGYGDRSYVLEHLLTAGFVNCLGIGMFEASVPVAHDVVAQLEDLAVEAEIDQRWQLAAGRALDEPTSIQEVLALVDWIESFAHASTRTEVERVLDLAPRDEGAAHAW